jgi:uncharacterized protein YerC
VAYFGKKELTSSPLCGVNDDMSLTHKEAGMDYFLDPKVCCIKGCDKETVALGMCVNHWRRNRKHGSPMGRQTMQWVYRGLSDEEKFWAQVEKTDTCWNWTSGKDKDGYGSFLGKVGDRVVYRRAHRFAYALVHGDIPHGMCVCHSCDNPPCVNPEHLFLGTDSDNMNDKISKGWHRAAFGEDAGKAILTEEQVRAILIDPRPHTAIAADYGVKGATIGSIKQRVSWSHITDVEPVHAVRVSAHKGVSDKITPEIVVGIRASNESYSRLAQKYGVSISTICDIRKRRSWAHVTD